MGLMDLPRERPGGLDSPWAVRGIKVMSRVQVRVFRATNGRVGNRWRVGAGWRKPVPTLLLDHVGRTSGTRFTTPLLYLRDGSGPEERLVVVASQGGMARHPQWYRNLLVTPDTTVHLPREVRRVRARVAGPEERAELWPRLVELYADFEKYASWTDREIPVVVLDPR
jgi:F420H(2)-dependent quinone reductase